MQFAFTIDWDRFAKDLRRSSKQLEAIVDTTANTGVGEVVVSARKKFREERGKKVMHGRFIANMLRSNGHDPFDLPDTTVREVQQIVGDEIEELIVRAYRTGRPQSSAVQRVMRAGADHLAREIVRRVTTGQLGRSVGRYGKRKAILANQGKLHVTKQYGNPPPVGVFSGRFVRGIRHRWRLGRRRRRG